MRGYELAGLRGRLTITSEALARELGTSPTAISMVELRKSVSVTTASRYVAAAFNLARRDIIKRERLAAELKVSADILQRAADRLALTP